ncbi:MAG: hypothetical protein ACU85V_11735 [Gammaproteobacteria bacterium]
MFETPSSTGFAAVAVLALTASAAPGAPIRLDTLDQAGQPVGGDELTWWLRGEEQHKRRQRCAGERCSQWQLTLPPAGPAVLEFGLSRRHGACWDLFSGSLPAAALRAGDTAELRLEPGPRVCR